jgi:thioredoxin-dependent peroxiredoxin
MWYSEIMATEPHVPGRVPEVTFKTRVRDDSIKPNPYRWQDVTTSELFSGKKIVLFGLPGAFTPTCSSTHLPGYDSHYDTLKSLGVDDVYCLSVNDAFVMNRWGEHLEVDQVKLIPDGNADFTRGMGMLVKKENLGFGERSWRYSAYIVDGEIKKIFIEPGFSDNCPDDPFEVSDVGTMLAYLQGLQS